MRSRHDFKIPVPGCASQAAQLQQKVFRDFERIFLLEPGQPLSIGRGQRGVGPKVRHHCVTGKVSIIILYTINQNCGCTSYVSNWFDNKRIRYKKNIVKAQEEANMYAAKAAAAAANPAGGGSPWGGAQFPGGGSGSSGSAGGSDGGSFQGF